MDSQKEMIVIEKEYYYKTYMEQRQKLHVNLVQQLHLRAEAKKNHLLSKSNEIIDKFINYRDEFLKNMPAELKALKVKDYINQSDGTLQVFLKQANNEGSLGNLYKLFQHEFEKVHNNQAQKPTENFLYNNHHDKQNSEQDDTVLEFIDSIKENTYQKPKFDLESNKPSAMKSKVKIVATPIKSTKKRKFDQITSAGKENINLGLLSKSKAPNGNGNGTAKKVLLEKTNTMKMQPIPSQNPLDFNKLTTSPNKRPWMP